jgi:hypothetical protein
MSIYFAPLAKYLTSTQIGKLLLARRQANFRTFHRREGRDCQRIFDRGTRRFVERVIFAG